MEWDCIFGWSCLLLFILHGHVILTTQSSITRPMLRSLMSPAFSAPILQLSPNIKLLIPSVNMLHRPTNVICSLKFLMSFQIWCTKNNNIFWLQHCGTVYKASWWMCHTSLIKVQSSKVLFYFIFLNSSIQSFILKWGDYTFTSIPAGPGPSPQL